MGHSKIENEPQPPEDEGKEHIPMNHDRFFVKSVTDRAPVAQLVEHRAVGCHAGGRGFEPRPDLKITEEKVLPL